MEDMYWWPATEFKLIIIIKIIEGETQLFLRIRKCVDCTTNMIQAKKYEKYCKKIVHETICITAF